MRWIKNRRLLSGGVLTIALVAWLSPDAHAIQVTINSIAKLAGDTANFSQNNSANAGEFLSSVSTLNGGTDSGADIVGAIATGQTRYAGVIGSDSNAFNFGSRNDSATSSYQVVFTVAPSSLQTVYDVDIATSWLGALVNRDEGSGAGNEAIVSNVTGTINGGSGTGTLNLPISQSQSSNATLVTPVNQSADYLLTGQSGTNTYTVQFTWSQSTGSANNITSGADEAVVIFGLPGTAALIGAADDYPGTSGRTQATDGHFVNITATVASVPEPSTFALAGVSMLGLVLFATRRRGRIAF